MVHILVWSREPTPGRVSKAQTEYGICSCITGCRGTRNPADRITLTSRSVSASKRYVFALRVSSLLCLGHSEIEHPVGGGTGYGFVRYVERPLTGFIKERLIQDQFHADYWRVLVPVFLVQAISDNPGALGTPAIYRHIVQVVIGLAACHGCSHFQW